MTANFHLTNNFTTDIPFQFGNSGDTPMVGDWDADGWDSAGVWRSATWYLRNAYITGRADIEVPYGSSTDKPRMGDWRWQ